MAKQTEKQKKKIAKVMREFKKKKLPIGKSKKKVKSRKQVYRYKTLNQSLV